MVLVCLAAVAKLPCLGEPKLSRAVIEQCGSTRFAVGFYDNIGRRKTMVGFALCSSNLLVLLIVSFVFRKMKSLFWVWDLDSSLQKTTMLYSMATLVSPLSIPFIFPPHSLRSPGTEASVLAAKNLHVKLDKNLRLKTPNTTMETVHSSCSFSRLIVFDHLVWMCRSLPTHSKRPMP